MRQTRYNMRQDTSITFIQKLCLLHFNLLKYPQRSHSTVRCPPHAPDGEVSPALTLVDPVVEHGGGRDDEEGSHIARWLVQLRVLVHTTYEGRLLSYDVNLCACLSSNRSNKADNLGKSANLFSSSNQLVHYGLKLSHIAQCL